MYICYVITIYKFDIFPKISIFKCALYRSTTSCKNILYSGLKKMLQKYALPPKRKEITLIKLGYYSAGWQKEFETIKND